MTLDDPREVRLEEPHVLPLMERAAFVLAGYDVPNIDPNDGGVDALVLILLETPAPALSWLVVRFTRQPGPLRSKHWQGPRLCRAQPPRRPSLERGALLCEHD
jgi:hypothetical protein